MVRWCLRALQYTRVGLQSTYRWHCTMSPPKVIIDTDAGTDDALALFMALEAHKRGDLQVIAITTVQGNTSVQNVNVNVLRVLEAAGLLEDVPVYSGASQSLVVPWVNPGPPFHGHDGLGDADYPPPPPTSLIKPQHAVWALTDTVKKHPDEVTLAALGPLTNIALAMRLEPDFTSHLAAFYVMGGNTTGLGNITVSGEFNFTCDPEAAMVVLEETKQIINLVPWEFCLFDLRMPYEERKELGKLDTPAAKLINKAEAKIMAKREFEYWITCDQLAIAWMVDDLKNVQGKAAGGKCAGSNGVTSGALLKATKSYFATVEVYGRHARGQMVGDHDGRLNKKDNVRVMTEIDSDLYKRYLRMAFGGGFQ